MARAPSQEVVRLRHTMGVRLPLALLALGLAVAQGDGPAEPEPEHGLAASRWDAKEVEKWLFEEGFGFLRAQFEAARIDGRALLAMRDHRLEVDFQVEPSALPLSATARPPPLPSPHTRRPRAAAAGAPQRSATS